VLGCAGVFAFAISAVAGAVTGYKTTISFKVVNTTVGNVTRPTVEGKLRSSKAACVKDREVYGSFSTVGDPTAHENLGPVVSDRHGNFTLRADASPGSLRKVMVVAFRKAPNSHSLCATETKTKTF